jgi:hypothetical protein
MGTGSQYKCDTMALNPFFNYSLSDLEIAKLWIKDYEWLDSDQFRQSGASRTPIESDEEGILNQMVFDDPQRAWRVIAQIPVWIENQTLTSDTKDPDDIAGFLGAGPLEDLLGYDGSSIIKQAIELAKVNQYFNIALNIVDDFGFRDEVIGQLKAFRELRPQ